MKAIVFDLGGVILPLNRPRAEAAFRSLNVPGSALTEPFDQAYAALVADGFFDQFEKGLLSVQEFLAALARLAGSDETVIAKVWQGILEPIPPENLRVLAKLAQKYPLYLLSNTNALHMDWIFNHVDHAHGLPRFGALFQRLFLSYELHMRKPEPIIYQTVAEQIGLKPAELMFVDDHPENVQAGRQAGWGALLHPANALLAQSVQPWL
ncbi:MAG: HAD-IA family hydrolase [Bacteroidetes bacterium]|nr:HAD-IA family hydrolase [Bacteroidota bacterium]